MNRRFLIAVLVILPGLYSCGEYREYTEPDQPVVKREAPIPPEYQEEYRELTQQVTHYHEGTLPTINRTHARAHSRIGMILFEAGNLERARENLDRSINMDPGLSESHFYLGQVLGAQGKTEGAIKEYETALRLEPNLAEAHRLLAESYEKLGYPDKALAERNRYESLKSTGN